MSMEIRPSEIDEVENIGELDDSNVKLVRTVGGLYIAVGKPKGKTSEEVLGAGSHSAIVKYNIQKSFRNFRPVMEKSDKPEAKVTGLSENLSKSLRDNGYDLYKLEKSNHTDLIITKHSLEVAKINLDASSDTVKVNVQSGQVPQGAGQAVAISAARHAASVGADKVEHAGKVFSAKRSTK